MPRSLATSARSESIQFSVTVAIKNQEVISDAQASYVAPSLCLDCRFWGNHRINGAAASTSWSLFPTDVYQQRLTDWVHDGGCYTGFIEGWGAGGFHGSKVSTQQCALCVLWTETYGSGSISGAPIGKSTYNCGAGVTLIATPASGWRFVRWNGDISSTSSTLGFTLNASKSLTAFFEQIPPSPPPKAGNDLPECPTSPVLVDLDDDGFHLTSLDDAVAFDIDGDGSLETISWTALGARDAFVVFDRNRNGRIDDGTELFGTATPLADGLRAPNGYVALAEFDEHSQGGNEDGVLDDGDAIWKSLFVWSDLDHDAVSTPGELHPLSEVGLVAIHLDYSESGRRDRYGNRFRYKAKAVMRDSGHEHSASTYDVFFRMAL